MAGGEYGEYTGSPSLRNGSSPGLDGSQNNDGETGLKQGVGAGQGGSREGFRQMIQLTTLEAQL